MRAAVQHVKRWLPWVFVVWALDFIYRDTLTAHVTRGLDPRFVEGDARQQIYPFFRYVDSSLFPNDYIADYYLDCLPVGFRALYTLSAFFIDPAVFSVIVTYVTLLITVVAVGIAADRLGGKVAAWCAMALVFGASHYIDRMGGGLPRAFGFPVLACGFVALAYGRTKWLGILTWVGACFYPVAGVIVGLTTALVLLLLPASDRGDARDWSLWKRLGFLSIVAGVSLVLMLPTIVTSSKYAPVLTVDDVGSYPEVGPKGRYGVYSRAPYRSFQRSALGPVERGFVGAGEPWSETVSEWVNADKPPKLRANRQQGIMDLVVMITVVGWVLFIVAGGAPRRVVMMGLAAFIGYTVGRFVAPYLYLPTRYTSYTMPLLVLLMASTSVAGFFSSRDGLDWGSNPIGAALVRAKEWIASRGQIGAFFARTFCTVGALRAGMTFAFCLVVLLSLGGRGPTKEGFDLRIGHEQLYAAIAELPADSVIAGWPNKAIENVPYVSRRAALLTFETHQVFHKQYTDEMRKRMSRLIDAMFATSEDPLVRLRDEQGVTHMLVYLPHLQGEGLKYFKPFDGWIARAKKRSEGKLLVLHDLVENRAIYRDRKYAIIDLRELGGSS